MEKMFDTHAHYFDEKYKEIPEGAEGLLSRLFEEQVEYVLNAATSTADSLAVLELCDRFPGCYGAVGVHPENCDREGSVEEALRVLRTLCRHEKVVAVGEIGLDYHWEENPPKEVQKAFFRAQMELAGELGLPAVIHDRDAHGDTFELLSEFSNVPTVLHSYSGSPEMARQYLQKGERYISFSGVLTYKNAVQTVETARLVPLDRMLLETDCPYLPPVPYRGKMNHSGYMIETAKKLAEIKEISLEKLIFQTKKNALSVFGIQKISKK